MPTLLDTLYQQIARPDARSQPLLRTFVDAVRPHPPLVPVNANNVFQWKNEIGFSAFRDIAANLLCGRPPWDASWVEFYDARDHTTHAVLVTAQGDRPARNIGPKWCSTNDRPLRWYRVLMYNGFDDKIACVMEAGFATLPNGAIGPSYFCSVDESVVVSESALNAAYIVFGLTLLTFQFCHARNVTVQERAPSRADRRRAEKQGMPAPVTFRTIDITGTTRVLEREGQVRTEGLGKALHRCRGHFADYRDGKGLFGRHKGVFWVPEHTRGRDDRGLVVSDYRIK